MPKMKTHRGAAKRFKVTANGKVKFQRAKRRHILEKKSTKGKRDKRGGGILSPGDERHVKALLPYK